MITKTPAAYCDVFELFESYKVPYVVVGSVAVVLHGHVRPVFDLDIVVASTPDEQNLALRALMLAGFMPSIPVPMNLLVVQRMFDQTEREIDAFVKYYISFAELWADSVQMRVGDGTARVASLEHLLVAKRAMGRPHDLVDVAGLLAIHKIKVTSDD